MKITWKKTLTLILATLFVSGAVVTGGVIHGCNTIGVPQAQTFNERVAFAMTTVTGIRETATALLTDGAITVEDAKNIQAQADTAREGIDLAIQVHATDPAVAENRLLAAQVIVDALKAYLRSQQK